MSLRIISSILLLTVLSAPAHSRTMPLWKDSALVGRMSHVTAHYEDTLAGIGDRHSLGYLELVNANPGVDPWLPGEGTPIVLPSRFILPDAPREGIVINLAEFRLYYYHDQKVSTYPVGVGTSQSPSPLTHTKVTMRLESPAWYPPESVLQEHKANGDPLPRMIPPGPDNPLGPFALLLAEDGYLIHGTNKNFGIGMQVSHGCIRMYNEDISKLVWEVAKGTPVYIVDQPVKFGLQDNILWVEVHQGGKEYSRENQDRLWQAAMERIQVVMETTPGLELNRTRLERAIQEADGIPHRIGEVVPTRLARDKAEDGATAKEG